MVVCFFKLGRWVTQACGSGGTAAGLALGLHLSGLGCQLHALGVCDDPQYFYDYIDGLLQGMGAAKDTVGQLCLHSYCSDSYCMSFSCTTYVHERGPVLSAYIASAGLQCSGVQLVTACTKLTGL